MDSDGPSGFAFPCRPCLCGHRRDVHVLGEVPCSCAHRDDGTPPLFDCDCDGFGAAPRELTDPGHLFHDGTHPGCAVCLALDFATTGVRDA